MSRRGGKRRQVLQLGDSSSKLHRYGYSKGFQSMESSVQTNLVTGLVGDYSDSDSDSNSNSDQKTVTDLPSQPQPPPTAKDEPSEGTPPPTLPVVQEPVVSVKNDAPKEDPMDDELRNFLSEIEAIPMPDESKTPEHLSEGGPSPTPTNQPAVPEKGQGDATLEDSTTTSKMASSGVSKKMSGAYSMFVKGDVEFAHSPSSTPPVVSEAADESQDRTKPTDGAVTDSDFANIPEEPTTCWQMVQDENTQYYYYWNWKTNQVTWEIPSDYTQYLLLHKEYKEKMAKVPPHVLQAWKERKAGKEKVTSDNQSNGHSMERDLKSLSKNSLSADLTTASAKIHSERRDEEGDDRYSHHHHRKKKSKKHKRRRNSSSDEDLDEKYLRSSEDSASVKSSLKSKKSKPVIGPQPLSIVPYMSDDNDEDSGNDGDSVKAKDETKDEVVQSNTESSRVESTTSPVRTKTSGPTSPVPVPVSGDLMETETVKPDFESLVQNLVEFHDKMTLPGKRADVDDSNSVTDNVKEIDLDGVEMKNDNGEENEEGLTNSVSGELRKEEVGGEDLKKDNEATNDSESSEVCDNTSCSKEKERQNIFDQFSVIREKKQKKKKKVINMFAEDSQSEIDENIENKDSNGKDVSKSASDTTLKSEMEDGELSDGSESLTKNAEVPKDTNHKRGKANTTTNADTTQSSDKQQTSSTKGIVGYSEEDEEEEEGELKEEGERTSKAKEASADKDEVVSEPKKRVLQYKDYMKKYRSGGDKATSNTSSNDNVNSSNNEDGKKDTSVNEKELNHSPSPTPPSHLSDSKSCVGDVSKEEKEAIVQPPVATNVVVEEKMDEEEVVENKQAEVDNGGGEDDDDSEDDFDLDDLDNIDRVLEKALEKKRDQKTEIKEETVVKAGDQTDASSQVSSTTTPSLSLAAAETKKTETDRLEAAESSSVDGSTMSETDMKRLKYAVKDSAELALHKLQFLDISTKNLSKLQVLLVELQTRYNDWQSGGLSTPYFHNQLKSSEALLSQYEESAVPPGWSCQWDRASCRYFYRNEQSGHTQWEYPQIGGGTGAAAVAEGPSSSTTAAATTTTASSSSSLSKVKGGEVKDAGGSSSSRGRSSKTKRRSKDADEREESGSKSRGHNSSSRSSRSHRSNKKGTEKDRGKRDRHASSSHHHRKKKRRRRDHSSSSSSSEEESTHSSRHRHRSKRKKRGRSDKSPSLELIDYEGPETVQVIEDSPPAKDPGGDRTGSSDDGGLPTSHRPLSATLGLIADYGSDQDMDEDDDNDEEKETTGAAGEGKIRKRGGGDVVGPVGENGVSAEEKSRGLEEGEVDGIDGVEMRKGGGGDGIDAKEEEDDREEEQEEAAEEEEVNNAVIVKPPQIIVPPYVAAMNQPQLYSAPALYASAPVPSSTTTMTVAATAVAPPDYAEQEHELGETTSASAATSHAAEETDKATKKKKKEKSLNANSSIMMKKKRVSSMVQKWQQVKKEVEKENRDKELRQAAIREKINQLKSST